MFLKFYFLLGTLWSLQLIIEVVNASGDISYSPVYLSGQMKYISRAGEQDVPDSCKGMTYCYDKPKDYPQDEVDKLVQGNKGSGPKLIETESRQGSPNAETDCEYSVEYQPLYKVRSDKGWHTVVQSEKENYVQMVRLETCKNAKEPCFKRFTMPPDLVSFCYQSYSYWEFVVLKQDNSGTEKVKVQLPICCSCRYKGI